MVRNQAGFQSLDQQNDNDFLQQAGNMLYLLNLRW
jgi:hypothetical protein